MLYLRIKRWVDALWGDIVNYKLLFLPIVLPATLIALLAERGSWLWWPFGALSVIWMSFISWRGFRVGMAASKAADLQYDRKGKLNLSEEYWNTESATKALRHRRRRRPKS